ncbi:MAG: 3-phosphoshikimate 1-carboxyvinyltransferase [Prevotella sp.]|nr:3-phosphoshikimate 1-carboxyvinyltransferase [Prevotella sp.]
MQYELTAPKDITGHIDLPSSKSISNRALVISALAGGGMIPRNLSDCDDTDVMIKALRDMPEVIDIKAAGTAMRFMTAFLSVHSGTHVITGTERMRHRPISVLVNALRRLGATVEYVDEEGYPPLRVTGGTIDGGMLEIQGNVSSQYISALLMIGPAMRNGLTLNLIGDVISRPYIDLTLCMMNDFGADAVWKDNKTIEVRPRPYTPLCYDIENDWSAASYWYEAVALGGKGCKVTLTGLTDSSRQGDSSVRYLFSLLGVKTVFESAGSDVPRTVTIENSGRMVPRLEYDFINAPDLAQTFVTCCAALGVPFHFKGLQTLKIKETDRIEALKAEMHKLGFVIEDIDGRELKWTGERCEQMPIPVIDTYEDHRMALAFAPLSIKIAGLRINNPGVVTKSYPHYWDDLRSVGFDIRQL